MILLTFMSCYLQILRLYLRRNISDIARITLVINATVYIYVIECNTVRYEIHDNISLLFLLILLFFISFFFFVIEYCLLSSYKSCLPCKMFNIILEWLCTFWGRQLLVIIFRPSPFLVYFSAKR
jgi:hypothetical protein